MGAGLFAHRITSSLPRSICNTARYRNTRAVRAWFCVDVATFAELHIYPIFFGRDLQVNDPVFPVDLRVGIA
jgi:hypothetical protein